MLAAREKQPSVLLIGNVITKMATLSIQSLSTTQQGQGVSGVDQGLKRKGEHGARGESRLATQSKPWRAAEELDLILSLSEQRRTPGPL